MHKHWKIKSEKRDLCENDIISMSVIFNWIELLTTQVSVLPQSRPRQIYRLYTDNLCEPVGNETGVSDMGPKLAVIKKSGDFSDQI